MVVQLPTWALVQRLICVAISLATVLVVVVLDAVVPDMISCVPFTLMLLTVVFVQDEQLATMVAVVAVAVLDSLILVNTSRPVDEFRALLHSL